ncbi:kinetochore protein NDC80 homolog [Selaginella moellendorffii]|uniref:kinetochore protein NDC80 homolog n=1 Tax=Selaginella moellendorffii TaxID=88036 RepID=UPI000D1C8E4B|nr:kinetochore protein NDC80 homolog [Selaginella moellendorffii]XP_024520663.1 kinetochore protein NDC80 homolog [Selaginella moellendorffii]|eukprot:XP_024520662.1 kinetochore protein NDC80 homolog [Selaginella moellendorffii]
MSSRGSNSRMSSIPAKLPRSSGVYMKRPSLGGPPMPPGGHHRPSLSRQSMAFSSSKGASAQDPRNINDKSFQKEATAELIEYLTTHGFNSPISSKLPSGKEIKDIIEFLFRQVDPHIVFGKLEDDVPGFFRSLNYPFQISKSALYAAGSPHSWPGLLAALAWLVNLLTYEEKAREIKEGNGGGFGYEGSGDLIFFEYLSQAYNEFLCGNDEACAKLDADFRVQFEEEKAQLVQQAEELEKTVNDLQAKLHTFTSEPSPLAVLESKKADFLNDVAKFTTIISNFQSHKEASLKKMEEKREDLLALKTEASNIAEENEALRQRIGAQQLSVAGVEKMDKESQILETRLHAVSKAAQELQKEAWDKEVQSANMLREVEDVVITYNTGSARLKNMYPELEARQVQLEMKVNSREEKPEDILGFNVKGVFKPLVASLMESIEKATRDAREEVLVMQKKLYADEVSFQEKSDEVSTLVTQNKKLEAQYKGRKERLDNYIASKAAQRAQFEKSLAEKQTTLRQVYNDAESLLKKLNADYEIKLKAYKEEMEQEQAEALEALQMYAEHNEYIQQALSRLEDRAGQVLKMARRD